MRRCYFKIGNIATINYERVQLSFVLLFTQQVTKLERPTEKREREEQEDRQEEEDFVTYFDLFNGDREAHNSWRLSVTEIGERALEKAKNKKHQTDWLLIEDLTSYGGGVTCSCDTCNRIEADWQRQITEAAQQRGEAEREIQYFLESNAACEREWKADEENYRRWKRSRRGEK